MRLYNEGLIKKWEKLRLEAYLPTENDVWTIGWGHTKGVKKGDKITVAQAQRYFDEDVAWAVNAVNKNVKVGLTQNQFDALTSFVFNIGETGFRKSTTLKRLNAGDYEGAAQAMTWWNKQDGKTLRGLVRRRAEEVELFLSPDDIEPTKNILPEIPANGTMKPLTLSKEVVGGVAAILTGAGSFLSALAPKAQENLSMALSVALVAFGVYFLINRIAARKNGSR